MHPIVGVRTAAQVIESMSAVDVVLPEEVRARLEAAVPFTPGPLVDFLAESERSPFAFGDAQVVARR